MFYHLFFRLFFAWRVPYGNGVYLVLLVSTAPVSIVHSWLLLRLWQRRLDEGRTPWFLRWHPVTLVGAIAVLLVAQALVGCTGLFTNLERVEYSGFWRLIQPFMLASPVLQCMVWLWWCDRPPRKVRAVGIAAGIWAVWMWSSSSLPIINRFPWNASLFHNVAKDLAFTLSLIVMYAFIAYALYPIARRAAAGLTHWSEAHR